LPCTIIIVIIINNIFTKITKIKSRRIISVIARTIQRKGRHEN